MGTKFTEALHSGHQGGGDTRKRGRNRICTEEGVPEVQGIAALPAGRLAGPLLPRAGPIKRKPHNTMLLGSTSDSGPNPPELYQFSR